MTHDALDYILGLYWYTSATVSPGSYLNMGLDCRALAFLNVFDMIMQFILPLGGHGSKAFLII